LIRRKSRQAVIQVLYQIEMSQDGADQALQLFWENYQKPDGLQDFVAGMVRGVLEHCKELDKVIAKTAANWSFSRLTPVDRSILREAVYEMLHCPDIPYKVTLNEAIELGKKFGSEKSGAFINGVLDNVYKQNPDIQKKKAL